MQHVTGRTLTLQQGGQYRLLLSSVLGHTPNKTEAWIFGDKGTLAFITPNNAEPYLQLGKKGGAADWQQVVHGWWRSTCFRPFADTVRTFSE